MCALILALAAWPAPARAAAQQAIGQVIVRIEGFEGWHQVRDSDLEVHLLGIPTHTVQGGAFRVTDLGVFGNRFMSGEPVAIDDDSKNFVRFVVGRKRITLPIAWRGRVRGDTVVMYAVDCELLPGGLGACQAYPPSDELAWDNRIRRMLGLEVYEVDVPSPAELQPVEVSAPKVASPPAAPPAQPAPLTVTPPLPVAPPSAPAAQPAPEPLPEIIEPLR